MPSQGSQVKLLEVPTALYLRDVELIFICLMRAFYESLILLVAFWYVKQLGLERGEDPLAQIL